VKILNMKRLSQGLLLSAPCMLASLSASAAIPSSLLCTDAKKVDCIRDNVLVLDGAMAGAGDKELDYAKAMERLKAVLLAANQQDLKWDTVAVFSAGFGSDAPAFYRTAAANPVGGIGLPVLQPAAGQQYVGYITGGNSATFSGADAYANCAEKSLCYDGFYNGFQALASAVGRMYGPYITLPGVADPLPVALGVKPKGKTVDDRAMPRIWNSLYDFDGSLLGGNNWRKDHNGTVETQVPSADWEAAPPLQGKQLARFAPLELYLMGLVPLSEVGSLPDFSDLSMSQFLSAPGSADMGMTKGTILKAPATVRDKLIDLTATVEKTNGARTPAYAAASHSLKQLWVIVTKPGADADNEKQIVRLSGFRSQWPAYFYLLTGYRGRIVTTVDASTDDFPGWEFGLPADDQATFKTEGGLSAKFMPRQKAATSPAIETEVVVDSPGAAGVLRFATHANQLPLAFKIGPSNASALQVRMRLPLDAPTGAYATVKLEGGAEIKFPNNDEGLLNDDRWHTYTASLLGNDALLDKTITGFSLSPTDKETKHIEIDSIRFANLSAANLDEKDVSCEAKSKSDGWLAASDNCPAWFNPKQEDVDQNGVGDACEDFDNDNITNNCDNCPTLSNPQQDDICNKDLDRGCFLAPDSVVGVPQPVNRKPLGLLLIAIGALGAWSLRRWRRK
jgi:hypothetical protein